MTGKKTGNSIYIHTSAMDTLSPTTLTRVLTAIIDVEETDPRFFYNFLVITPTHIDLVEAEDFDITHEPVLGQRYRVDNDDSLTYIPRPNKPRVLHQRYKTVSPDYTGFDIEVDKEREKWYRSHFDGKRMAGAGFEHKWIAMLAEISEKESKSTCNAQKGV